MKTDLRLSNSRIVRASYNILRYGTRKISLFIGLCGKEQVSHNELMGAYIDQYRVSEIETLACHHAVVVVIDTNCQ